MYVDLTSASWRQRGGFQQINDNIISILLLIGGAFDQLFGESSRLLILREGKEKMWIFIYPSEERRFI